MKVLWCFFLLLHDVGQTSGPSNNTPPVLVLERNWKIPENEPVGSRIERVRGRDAEHDPLVFALQRGDFLDGSRFFRIDSTSGDVYLNQTLKGQAGAQFYLYVTASDGMYQSKMEVFVEVINPGNPTLSPTLPKTSPIPAATAPRNPLKPNSILPIIPPPNYPQPPPIIRQLSTLNPPIIQSVESNPPRDQNSPELGPDVTATIITVLAVIGLAPLVGLGVWLLQRRCLSKKELKEGLTDTKDTISTITSSVGFSGNENRAFSSFSSNDSVTWPGDVVDNDGGKGINHIKSKWEFPRHHLKLLGTIGEGCFGQVWKGQAWNICGCDGATTVAVKTLKGNAGERETKDLLSELQVMKALEPHPNVVRFLGACTEKDPIYVIMEFVPLGKLQTYLRNSRADHYYKNLHGSSKSLTSRDLTSFAYQVARAMDFLSSKGIIHRDLAARNILVGENKTCKVADFGFARDIVSSHIYERKSDGRLPIRWMASESLFDNMFSVKTDVWSFGVLMWEIVTLGSTPYPGLAASEVIQSIRQGTRLEKPEHCKREMYNIMYYCWYKDPDERPTFAELAQSLDQLLISDTEYIELERFPDHLYYNVVSLSSEKL